MIALALLLAAAPAVKTVIVPAGEERAYDEWHYAPVVRVGDLIFVSGIPAARGDTYEAKARDTESFQKGFAEFARLHHEYFPSGYPAWTAVGTTALLAPGAVLEMRVVAAVGGGKNTKVLRPGK